MKFWKDKEGNWIDGKEFKKRFLKGVEGISPLQQTRSQLVFSSIMIIGILCGIVASIWNIKTLWWLLIVLIAALGNTIIGHIGIYQKYAQLKRIEKMIKEEHYGL